MNILDLIFPNNLYCVSCSRPLPQSGNIAFCESCASEIPWITGKCCAICGRPLAAENPKELCRDCGASGERKFRKGYACALYMGPVAELVRNMKYKNRSWYADTFAASMAARYLAETDPETGELPCHDYLISVPMSERKKSVRGFNQAALLAKGLSGRIGTHYLKDALKRVRETDVMSSLSADERRQNLANAFIVPCNARDFLAGSRLLLVDDVYTTGSTADACAEVLLAAGAESVDIFVFAIGADVRREENRPLTWSLTPHSPATAFRRIVGTYI